MHNILIAVILCMHKIIRPYTTYLRCDSGLANWVTVGLRFGTALGTWLAIRDSFRAMAIVMVMVKN